MTDPDAVVALEDAAATYREYDDRIESHGERQVEAVADAHGRATALLDRYEGRATGTGDFEAFVTFQGEFSTLVEELPDDLPERDAFEQAEDRLDKRRLNESDFAAVRELLSPAAEVASLLDRRETARADYRAARKAVARELQATREDIEDRERLLDLGDADLDAPVADLREPVEAYNEAVAEAFADYKREASARDVVAFLDATDDYPLVPFDPPPENLRAFVNDSEVGTESVADLLEYADYSESKLDHYVADPMALKRAVATNETYLRRLDATPLELQWPPKPAVELRYRAEELVRVLDRFAPAEPIERLREVRDLTHDEAWFERLRTAATAEAELSDGERDRLASGAVEAELADLRAKRDRLAEALADHPER